MYKNGERVGIYKSIESAISDMTDLNADYEIIIGGFYSLYDGAPVHTLDVKELPKVRSFKITGKNYPAEPGYIDRNTILSLSHSITSCVGGNLTFENLEIQGGTLKLEDAVLTLCGDTAFLDVVLSATDNGCVVNVYTEDTTYFIKKVSIYKLISGDHEVVFYNSGFIEYVDGDQLYTGPGGNIKIENYC